MTIELYLIWSNSSSCPISLPDTMIKLKRILEQKCYLFHNITAKLLHICLYFAWKWMIHCYWGILSLPIDLSHVTKSNHWSNKAEPAQCVLYFWWENCWTVLQMLPGQVQKAIPLCILLTFITLHHPLFYPSFILYNLPCSHPQCIVICCNLMD